MTVYWKLRCWLFLPRIFLVHNLASFSCCLLLFLLLCSVTVWHSRTTILWLAGWQLVLLLAQQAPISFPRSDGSSKIDIDNNSIVSNNKFYDKGAGAEGRRKHAISFCISLFIMHLLSCSLTLQTIRKETNDGCSKVAKLHCSNLLSPLSKDSANLGNCLYWFSDSSESMK